MNRETLRALQTPVKERYMAGPESALVTLRAEGLLGNDVTCIVQTHETPVTNALAMPMRSAKVIAEGDDFGRAPKPGIAMTRNRSAV